MTPHRRFRSYILKCMVAIVSTLLLGLPLNFPFAACHPNILGKLSHVKLVPGLVINTVMRDIDLVSQSEIVTTTLEVQNEGDSIISFFLYAVSASKFPHLSMLQGVTQTGENLQTEPVTVTGLKFANAYDESKFEQDTHFFKVQLSTALEPGNKQRFQIVAAYTHTLTPLPAQIAQMEDQYVEYYGSFYMYSPYFIKKHVTEVVLASDTIEAYTNHRKARINGDSIKYGPFKNLSPFSIEESSTTIQSPSSTSLYIHFMNNNAFVTMLSMIREIEISHWGNIAVQDQYVMSNTGAKLKGGFSRFEFGSQESTRGEGASFSHLSAYLPWRAKDIYYRDSLGNISTSTLVPPSKATDQETVMRVYPRYPMFGGWRNDFVIGYNVPTRQYLSRDLHETNHYLLAMPFGCPFPEAVVDDAQIRVILPEGAHDIEWQTSYPIDSFKLSTRLTYLDTTGRPVLTLKKGNIVGLHTTQLFYVSYRFNAFPSMWREPLLVFGVLMLFYLIAIFCARVDLRIGSNTVPHIPKEKTL